MYTLSIEFCEEVYDMVRLIPSGFVMGYKDVANAIGYPKRARHVGFALSSLPRDWCQPNTANAVPWWRVIRSDGSIALQGDLQRGTLQRMYLISEQIHFLNTKIDMKKHRWKKE